jgi:methylated-DNA-[protein]-cysteine S-methyltransferase/AraC family transcriptional regulator of adaptative response/methylated-DNA-[protein]-cysteine methyltransferase
MNLMTNEAALQLKPTAHFAKVIRFVDEPAEGLHLTRDMRGTSLQRRVWQMLRTIPVGPTWSPTPEAMA